jgi:hypothetical protein
MVEQTHNRFFNPDNEARGETIPRRGSSRHQFGRSASSDFPSEEALPLFLSGYEDEPEQQDLEAAWDGDQRKSVRSPRMVTGIVAATAVAMVCALFSVEATRTLILNTTASFAGMMPIQPATARPDSTQLTAADIQLKDSTWPSAPAVRPQASTQGVSMAAAAPTREEIAAAYQSALQARAPVSNTVAAATPPTAAPPAATLPAAVAPIAAPAVRRLDADELATLMKRAKGLIDIGDVPAARLLLERTADAHEASAALLLAQTYDPAVLGGLDQRSLTADPDRARVWYRKAAEFGSPDAQRRLAEIQN